MSLELRPYQKEAVDKSVEILRLYNIVYLACQMRTGKTFISLSICNELGYKNVCFITKKMAMVSVEKDKHACGYDMTVDVFSMDSAHKIQRIYDIYIIDEAHLIGSYPKPAKRATAIYNLVHDSCKPVILMSGTPSAESYSQLYHQFFVSAYSPFKAYKTFYKWAKDYCKQYPVTTTDNDGNEVIKYQVKQKFLYGGQHNDYSEAIEEKVKSAVHKSMVFISQAEAGFKSFVEEEILTVPIDKRIYQLMDVLKKDKIYRMKNGEDVIIADTAVRLQGIFHQLSSGTIKITDPIDKNKFSRHVFDKSKAYFIKSHFAGRKIAIYYLFIEEGNVLKEVFPNWTTDQEAFNTREDLVFVCQIVSGSMGVDLASADCMVMYNIHFSATQYQQVRARQQSHGRTKASKMYWIFSEHGIERKVHRAVMNKEDYTLSYFKKDYKVR